MSASIRTFINSRLTVNFRSSRLAFAYSQRPLPYNPSPLKLMLPYASFTQSTIFDMKEAIVSKGPKVEIQNVEIPRPDPDQVLIRVVYSGSNPKDWKRKSSLNLSLDS